MFPSGCPRWPFRQHLVVHRTPPCRLDLTSPPPVLLKSQSCYKSHMSARRPDALLTKRERQIMDVAVPARPRDRGRDHGRRPGAPGNSTVRTQLRVLETKGHVKHEEQGLRYVYMPTVPRHFARKSALKHLVDTFFDGSSGRRSRRCSAERPPGSRTSIWSASPNC